jgi:AraC-like DNA-binding protein
MTTPIVRGDFGGSHWELATRGRMSSYVERAPGLAVRRELPGPLIAVILELGPPLRVDGHRHAGGFVAGLGDVPSTTEHDGFQCGVQLDLHPLEARTLFGVPMSELEGRVVSLDDLLPRAHLVERLAELPDHDARFDLLDRLLATHTAAAPPRARIARWACDRIERSGGNVDVRTLARELGYSEKQVARIFRDWVGLTPKRYGRLVRFHRLVSRLKVDPHATWAALAADLGFYDQAHLLREVRQFGGSTPTELRGSLFEVRGTSGT